MHLPHSALLALLPAYLAAAGPLEKLEKRACPGVHVFGARETTVSPGYGSSAYVVNKILAAYSGSTAEAISYPACGGQSSCGSISYSQSVQAGVAAAASAVNAFNTQCPDTQLVLVGYSQGGEIFDAALCGGGIPNQGYTNTAVLFNSAALAQIKAAIFLGDPLFVAGLPYNVGTCAAGGFDARPSGFSCPSASKIQSYCDSPDPYCCKGSDAATHSGYNGVYGDKAFAFVQTKLSSSGDDGSGGGGGTTPQCAALYGQCGGSGWTGATCCTSGTCKVANAFYSQCL